MLTRSRAVATADAIATARAASDFACPVVLSAVIFDSGGSFGAVLALRNSCIWYAPRINPSTAASRCRSVSVVMTAPTPLRDRAATPAARRINSAGHTSRGAPSPTASTLATGSDGTCTRVICSGAALAPRARRAVSISPIAPASRNGPAMTAGAPSSVATMGTISTADPDPRLGRLLATVTVGA